MTLRNKGGDPNPTPEVGNGLTDETGMASADETAKRRRRPKPTPEVGNGLADVTVYQTKCRQYVCYLKTIYIYI